MGCLAWIVNVEYQEVRVWTCLNTCFVVFKCFQTVSHWHLSCDHLQSPSVPWNLKHFKVNLRYFPTFNSRQMWPKWTSLATSPMLNSRGECWNGQTTNIVTFARELEQMYKNKNYNCSRILQSLRKPIYDQFNCCLVSIYITGLWSNFRCFFLNASLAQRDSHDRYYKLSVHPVEGGDAREVRLGRICFAQLWPLSLEMWWFWCLVSVPWSLKSDVCARGERVVDLQLPWLHDQARNLSHVCVTANVLDNCCCLECACGVGGRDVEGMCTNPSFMKFTVCSQNMVNMDL